MTSFRTSEALRNLKIDHLEQLLLQNSH
ncbi:MAG: hypothetical protein ACJA2S_005013 [Cyclobacteriaceae bacterium]